VRVRTLVDQVQVCVIELEVWTIGLALAVIWRSDLAGSISADQG
jgi:hypothetical protein